MKKFPEGFQKLFNLQVVEIIDRETTQPEIVAENKDLFKETINKSNLVDKINIYLFLRKFPEIDMNVHSNLVVYLAEQNTVVSYDSSGISRRKIGQNGVKLDNNIDTGLFMNWLNLSDKNKLFLNESFIQKDLHSCGSFATSILIFKLNFLYNKYTKLIEAEEIKNTNEVIQKLSGALFKEEEKFHSQVFQESKNIKTEGDIQSQQLMETKLDPALISLGQLKNVVELAKKLDKSLKDCEKFLNVASFFENRIIGDATLESFNVEVDERQVAILQDNKVNFVKSSSRSIQNTIKSIINNKCEIKSIAFKNEGKYYE